MWFKTKLAIVGVLLVIASGVEAKGPKSGGQGAAPPRSANASQGVGSNAWTTSPPGWTKNSTGQAKAGWGDSGNPSGWGSNTQYKGWDGDVPRGFQRRLPDLQE